MSIIKEPRYDEDLVNLGYFNKTIQKMEQSNKEDKKLNYNKNYSKTPSPPYYKNNTWTNQNKLYVCKKDRLLGSFSMSDWELVVDGSATEKFIDNIYNIDKVDIQDQIDSKIESYIQSSDPSLNWTTNIEKEKHKGDFWRKPIGDEYEEYVYTKYNTNPIEYSWKQAKAPQSIYDLIDSKKTIHLKQPNIYSKYDLWLIENDITEQDLPLDCLPGMWVIAMEDSTVYNKADFVKKTDNITIEYLETNYYTIEEVNQINEEISRTISSAITQSKDDILLSVNESFTSKETTESIVVDLANHEEQIGTINTTITSTTEAITQLSIENQAINILIEQNTSKITDTETNLNDNYFNKSDVENKFDNYNEEYTKKILEISANLSGLQLGISSSGGSNLLVNSIGYFGKNPWQGNGAIPYSDYRIKEKSGQDCCWLLKEGSHKQIIQVKNGKYTCSFKYEKLISIAIIQLRINGINYELKESFSQTFEVFDNRISIEFQSDTDNCANIMLLMLSEGEIPQVYSNHQSEVVGSNILMGEFFKITSTGLGVAWEARGNVIGFKNLITDVYTTTITPTGMDIINAKIDEGEIAKVLIRNIGSQTIFTRI